MVPESFDVIVIGLGIAGVAAATRLAKEGFKVLGLEADKEIGGRVKTAVFGDGVVELGAEWIHGTDDSKIYNAAITAGIPLKTQDIDLQVFRSDGTADDADLFNELRSYCHRCIIEDGADQDPQPLGQFVINRCNSYISEKYPHLLSDKDFMTEFFEFMNLYTNNHESSNDWNDVSTCTDYEELDGHQYVSWHRYGYRTLFYIMMNTHDGGPGIPNLNIMVDKTVVSVQWSDDPNSNVSVTCSDGTSYLCNSAIVTVSVGVLKERHTTLFSPKLTEEKVLAIENISIGTMDKIFLCYKEAWWPREGKSFYAFLWKGQDRKKIDDEDYWMTRIFGASKSMGSDNVLTLWTSGDVAKQVEYLPEDVVKRKATKLLRMFMGVNSDIPEPDGLLRSTWYSNPFTRGSYSFDNLLRPLYPDARRHLSAPLVDRGLRPRILFAGEATHEVYFSTAHGAFDTGLREAERIFDFEKELKAKEAKEII